MDDALENVPKNKINNFLDEKFVKKFLITRVLSLYPEFRSIKKINIRPIKKHIWKTTYHVVFNFEVSFLDKDNRIKKLPIYCSAHSDDPRKCVHEVLKFLWSNNFSQGYLTVPRPLFYSKYYNAVFYRGVKGHNLFYYIKKKDFTEVEKIVDKTAAWLAKLHAVKTENCDCNFNRKYNRIDSAIPGKKFVLQKLNHINPEFHDIINTVYEVISKRERGFLNSTKKRWLIHGDAHPENIIKIGEKKIAGIDFTDFCLSDFTRDLGSFLQQLDYMCARKTGEFEYTEKLKNIFITSYFKFAKINLDDGVKDRIKTYYNWTAFRTGIFFLLKHDPNPKRTCELLETICRDLEIKPDKALEDKYLDRS